MTREITILLQFLTIETRFVRKGCAEQLEIAILPQFLAIEPRFVRNNCAEQLGIAILPQLLTIKPHFVRKRCAGPVEIAILLQFLAIELHFVRKGCARRLGNRNFTSVFGDRTTFRAKGLRRTTWESQLYLSFWRSNLISFAPDDLGIATLFSVWRSNLISCERVARDKLKSQFYRSFWRSNLVSCERVAFRAVSLALPLPPPSEEK